MTTDQSSLWGNKYIPPRPGQVVPVKADPERRKAKWDRSKEANAAVLQDLIAQRQAATSEPQPDDRAAQLDRLATLKEQGALTDAEYEQARKSIERAQP